MNIISTGIEFEKLAEEAWDEAAIIHKSIKHEDWKKMLSDESTLPIDNYLKTLILKYGVENKVIGQLNCNNGRELLSIKMLGAKTCIGFDISNNALAEARSLAKAINVECQFIKADAQNLPDGFKGMFDLVIVTAGALCFIPDIDQYFAQIKKILHNKGTAIIFESHPFLNMFEMDRDRNGNAEIRYGYFRENPRRHNSGLDYYTHQTYDAKPVYYFNHTVSDIVTAAIKAGLEIAEMRELIFDPSFAFSKKAFKDINTPMGLVVILN